MKRIYESLSKLNIARSGFDLSFEKKLSCDMGTLIPIYLQEIIPNDQFRVNTEIMIRFAPMIAPIMHRVNVYTHYFFVPNRIVWDSWEEFINGGSEASGIQSPILPKFTITSTEKDDIAKGTLADYFGIPVHDEAGAGFGGLTFDINALPFRGYHLIWNEYYRDQHLSDEENIDTLTWANAKQLKKRAWEKDYFTSAAPATQRGPEILAPLDVQYLDQSLVKEDDGGNPPNSADLATGTGAASDDLYAAGQAARIENLDPNSIGTKISELRKAFKLQEYWELAMRSGTRYIEWLKANFGVTSSDARLQRPEYLGGAMQPVQISEVLNTAGDNAGSASAVGDMAGHGISVGGRNGFTRRFEEHGFVFGIMSILPRTAYQQGLHRQWFKFDRFDYYTPQLAHIGEQAILQKELYFDLGDPLARQNDNYEKTFGYGQRYGEYKQNFSNVHGDFKDNLDFWHMGRKWDAAPDTNPYPALNEDFVEADPTKRIFAVNDGTHSMWCQIYHDVKAIRPIPYFTDPKLV